MIERLNTSRIREEILINVPISTNLLEDRFPSTKSAYEFELSMFIDALEVLVTQSKAQVGKLPANLSNATR